MDRLSRKTIGVISLCILVVLVLVALFFKFDHVISGPARFVAYSEWSLLNSEQDKLKSQHFYNGARNKNDMYLFHFQRPDFIRFSLNEDLEIGTIVNAGDVVARLSSAEDDIRLAELKGQLEESHASLAALQTGEKDAFQRQASEELTYARAELQAYEPILQRTKELHEKNLVSDQELDIAQAQYDLYKINVDVAEARLQTVKTGAKQEAINVIRAQVNAVSRQIDLLQEKFQAATIKSPITGVLVQPDNTVGELCHICEIDSMIVQMPVKTSDVKHVHSGMPFKTYPADSRQSGRDLEVLNVSASASMINMQPMFMVTAIAPNTDYAIRHGMTGRAEIHAGKRTLFSMIASAWDNFRLNR